ncbi:MAG: hypothetical protein BWK73_37830 [Thiothrix lacustris]|uniref:Terminase n=1 Tax=Thiothrix lacustris TaxID=525917 RepID=A0A1Y1QF87_9GAMM|nr:MAG: hypothetical protein BWK73_37830 [Thiothrix lacustris]
MSNVKRVSGQQRIEQWNVAERELQRFSHDHYLWHKYVHNVELDAIQLLKCAEMDDFRMSLDFSSRRMGKTAVKELWFLKFLACNKDQELGIVAPREAQSLQNLSYHQDAIRRSEILNAYIDVRQGRRQLADTYYRFANHSKATANGIMANVDGGDLTCASLEEVDDMPHDRLFSRFLLMMGSTRRLGASKSSKNDPIVRITGVYKGADTLVELIDSGEYQVIGAFHGDRAKQEVQSLIAGGWLSEAQVGKAEHYKWPVPVGNAVNGMMLGLLNREFLTMMRGQLGEDEFARQLLCINTTSRNLIWQEWLQRAVHLGHEKAHLEPVIPVPGHVYKKRGLLAFGYDHTGHGEKPESSRSALVVLENLAGFVVPIFAKTWPPGTDESIIRRDLVAFWQYFRPDRAMGDAFGVGLIGNVNDDLFKLGLIQTDRMTLGDSTSSNWGEWAFAPIRFEGQMKHSMAVTLASSFSGGRVALVYVHHIQEGDEDYNDVKDLQWLYRQLTNIEAVATSKTYASYKMLKRDVGDDLFDAAMVGHWALLAGQGDVPTTILLGTSSRQRMLER